jgi:hypothetical protein
VASSLIRGWSRTTPNVDGRTRQLVGMTRSARGGHFDCVRDRARWQLDAVGSRMAVARSSYTRLWRWHCGSNVDRHIQRFDLLMPRRLRAKRPMSRSICLLVGRDWINVHTAVPFPLHIWGTGTPVVGPTSIASQSIVAHAHVSASLGFCRARAAVRRGDSRGDAQRLSSSSSKKSNRNCQPSNICTIFTN